MKTQVLLVDATAARRLKAIRAAVRRIEAAVVSPIELDFIIGPVTKQQQQESTRANTDSDR